MVGPSTSVGTAATTTTTGGSTTTTTGAGSTTSAPGGSTTTAPGGSTTTVAGGSTTTSDVAGKSNLSTEDRISTVGFGEVFIGMTVAEAEQVAATTLVADGPAGNECAFFKPGDGPDGVRFLVAFGRVAAVHVTNPEVRTRSGLGVGSTQDELVARLSAQLETRPSPYLPGVTETLFVPTDENDANQRIVFDVDGSGKTVGFRSGQLPEVLYGAACERPPA